MDSYLKEYDVIIIGETVDVTGFLGGLGLPIIFSWIVGGLFAASVAFIIGKIALGLRSDYLAIATLGISEIIIAVLKHEDWLSRGVKNVSGLDNIDKLIEIEENLVDSSLTIIQESIHIKEREELLVQIGRRAKSGENRYTRTGLTNQELADGLGMSKRNYLYFRSIANMDSEVLEISAINKEIIFGNLSLSIEYVISHQDVLFYVM